MDCIGKTKRVLQQIATESRQEGQRGKNLFSSLQILQDEMHHNSGEFIHNLGLKPVTIHFWSPHGVKLFHKLCKSDVIFIDATGSVVRKIDGCNQILYYELSCRNPKAGEARCPVAAMVTEDHSMSSISNWLTSFIHAEKRAYG